jgi:hypothetical protein
MTLKRINIICLFFLLAIAEIKAQAKKDYNIVWTTQSQNASESMPCGGGDIGMNVWVEKGELLIYVARSGNFDENNALFKTGRIRIKLFPNVFEGKIFKQELHLQEGYVTVEGENNGVKATVKIWTDVFTPVAHFDISSNKKITAEATYESWRYQDRIVKSRENFGNSWKWGAPKNNVYRKDEISFSTGGVLFYHHNMAQTIFDTTVAQQGLNSVKEQLYNPLKRLAFGGLFRGDNFIAGGESSGIYVNTDFKGWKLKSKSAAKEQSLTLILHNQQVNSFGEWHQELKTILLAASDKRVFTKTQNWWKQFWNRSFINIDEDKTDSKPWQVGRNYQLFRYMLACNAHSAWPTKFNGGLLTVDPVFTDKNHELTPDYRNWGGGLHPAQNQRLVYFPMIKAGDWDMLQPQFDFYLRILKNAELRSKIYWNHNGACFTEQMENYGLPDYVEYGQNRPTNFDKGLEYNAWLEYEWDTVLEFCLMMLEENTYTGKDISDKIPFIESCLRFFDEHYQYLAKQRGAKALDGNGQLVLYPGSGAETFKMANNSTSTITALSVVSKKLLDITKLSFYKLPFSTNTVKETDSIIIKRHIYLEGFVKRLPPINFQSFNGHITISPAKTWERINNTESTQLYPVFPWGIYGVGKPGLDTAINTWKYDTFAIKFRSHIGWKQDNIFAARLGLTDDAWKYTSLKLQDGERRFPAFWGPGFDWLPDHNWGGSGMIGLQEMLLQTDDKHILLFPAWPKDKDVHFKLHAPYNTTVEATLKDGKMISLIVLPEERRKDVEMLLPLR